MENRNIISIFTLVFVILGLFTACGDSTEPDVDPTKPDSNYTVTFEANGGSPAPDQQSIAYGGKIVMPLAMTKTGFGFGGWYSDAACVYQWNFDSYTVTSNITLYAKWDITGSSTCTVTFNANGGSSAPTQQSISYGGKVVMPPAMTKTGYGFGGWYKEATCTNQWNFDTDTVTGNITLYAKWDVNYHTVSFNANGGSPTPTQQSIANGGKVVMPPVMTKTDYGFGGWYKEATCTNKWNFSTNTVTGNITLYAKWDVNYHTVNFNANSGIPAPDPQSITHSDKVVMPPVMLKTGYSFSGWYKEAACTNQWDYATDTVSGNITLYAKWDLNYHIVNFEANGGSPTPNPQTISYGEKVTMPPAMSKNSNSFGGWYKEADCTNQWNFAIDIVTVNITLYAKWLAVFTVTFNAEDGTPPLSQQLIINGGKVSEPVNISKEGFTLEGWYKDASYINLWNFDSDTVTDNIILYAKWDPPIIVSGNTLAAKLQWLSTKATSNSAYILEVTSVYEDLAPQNLSYTGKNNITIQLKGIGSSRVIALSGNGSLFSIENGVTLILDEDLILSGKNNNTASLVQVNSGGKLILNQGVKITGNTSSTFSSGSGVFVNGGTFTMNGGEISGNNSYTYFYSSGGSYLSKGGGVSVIYGNFTMNGGEISGNTASSSFSNTSSSSQAVSFSSGGGVFVGQDGTFTMNSGKILGNYSDSSASSPSSSSASASFSYGGGVYVAGTFTMNGGEISGNTSSSSYSSSSSTRPSLSYGGGVYVAIDGTFTMKDGKISGNTTSSTSRSSSSLSCGGGVFVVNGTFTMSDGEISGNSISNSYSSSYSYGGGVCVISSNSLFFSKSGGTITGYASDTLNGNMVKGISGVVQSNRGHAVYYAEQIGSGGKCRETTAGPGDNLYSNVSGTAGGWEN